MSRRTRKTSCSSESEAVSPDFVEAKAELRESVDAPVSEAVSPDSVVPVDDRFDALQKQMQALMEMMQKKDEENAKLQRTIAQLMQPKPEALCPDSVEPEDVPDDAELDSQSVKSSKVSTTYCKPQTPTGIFKELTKSSLKGRNCQLFIVSHIDYVVRDDFNRNRYILPVIAYFSKSSGLQRGDVERFTSSLPSVHRYVCLNSRVVNKKIESPLQGINSGHYFQLIVQPNVKTFKDPKTDKTIEYHPWRILPITTCNAQNILALMPKVKKYKNVYARGADLFAEKNTQDETIDDQANDEAFA